MTVATRPKVLLQTAPIYSHSMLSPIGLLRMTAQDGSLTRLSMDGQAHAPEWSTDWIEDPAPFAATIRELDEYFGGKRSEFTIPLAPSGTAFQMRVWDALTKIPYGETRSYAKLAVDAGSPRGSRAVGLANGRNPIAIIIPCHRVIAADGSLGGYGGGLERKQFLLDLEKDS